mmetsp:Transcript_89301/g.289135  ORF Transcript_89301/g.289135 Transcript_89301/m.289135 type:complete len:417 (-) Transcript_89301:136-1386(-)
MVEVAVGLGLLPEAPEHRVGRPRRLVEEVEEVGRHGRGDAVRHAGAQRGPEGDLPDEEVRGAHAEAEAAVLDAVEQQGLEGHDHDGSQGCQRQRAHELRAEEEHQRHGRDGHEVVQRRGGAGGPGDGRPGERRTSRVPARGAASHVGQAQCQKLLVIVHLVAVLPPKGLGYRHGDDVRHQRHDECLRDELLDVSPCHVGKMYRGQACGYVAEDLHAGPRAGVQGAEVGRSRRGDHHDELCGQGEPLEHLRQPPGRGLVDLLQGHNRQEGRGKDAQRHVVRLPLPDLLRQREHGLHEVAPPRHGELEGELQLRGRDEERGGRAEPAEQRIGEEGRDEAQAQRPADHQDEAHQQGQSGGSLRGSLRVLVWVRHDGQDALGREHGDEREGPHGEVLAGAQRHVRQRRQHRRVEAPDRRQ